MDFKSEYVLALRKHVPTYLAALLRSGDLMPHLRNRKKEAEEFRQKLLPDKPNPTYAEEQEANKIVRMVFMDAEDLKAESAEFWDEDSTDENFDLSQSDLRSLQDLRTLFTPWLNTMSPSLLRSMAVFLLALNRLPRRTSGVDVHLSFRQPRSDGNYGWATVSISEDEIRLEAGEHFYDPAVGGDTETMTLCEAIAGAGKAGGDIGRWLEYAEARTRDGYLNVEHDGSAYDAIDWEADE